jgi:hypothetical protein
MYPIELYGDLVRDRQARLRSEARADRQFPSTWATALFTGRRLIGHALVRIGSLLAGADGARSTQDRPVVAPPARA